MKHIRITARVISALNLYHDKARHRFVVYRRALGVSRKTSVRYGRSIAVVEAWMVARKKAARLHKWPAEKLAEFVF